jgi:hypothetical protein
MLEVCLLKGRWLVLVSVMRGWVRSVEKLEAKVQPLLGFPASVWVLLMHLVVLLAGGLSAIGEGHVCVHSKPTLWQVH